jgi:excisionase family DNA binding protein
MPTKNEEGRTDLVSDGMFPIGEAIAYSGLGRSTLYALMERGELAYAKVGRRRLIPRRALAELMERCLVIRR